MAGSTQEEQARERLVEGLTADRLLSLADALRARGVVRFAVGAVSVEFAPQAVQADLMARASADQAAQDYRLSEASASAAVTKEQAACAALAKVQGVLASA